MFTVLIAGIPRSGSTWLYNIVRIMLQGRYASVNAQWIEDIGECELSEANVIKLHEPDLNWQQRANRILLSKRDLRDIAASLVSMGWARSDADLIDAARNARQMHDFWASYASLDLRYEDALADRIHAVRQVASALSFDLSDDELAEIAAKVPQKANFVGSGGYDPMTLLHPNHVNDGRAGRWREQIAPRVADAIWDENSTWLKANGYER